MPDPFSCWYYLHPSSPRAALLEDGCRTGLSLVTPLSRVSASRRAGAAIQRPIGPGFKLHLIRTMLALPDTGVTRCRHPCHTWDNKPTWRVNRQHSLFLWRSGFVLNYFWSKGIRGTEKQPPCIRSEERILVRLDGNVDLPPSVANSARFTTQQLGAPSS